eukprot:750995-Hanusia_phi.AAC.3
MTASVLPIRVFRLSHKLPVLSVHLPSLSPRSSLYRFVKMFSGTFWHPGIRTSRAANLQKPYLALEASIVDSTSPFALRYPIVFTPSQDAIDGISPWCWLKSSSSCKGRSGDVAAPGMQDLGGEVHAEEARISDWGAGDSEVNFLGAS